MRKIGIVFIIVFLLAGTVLIDTQNALAASKANHYQITLNYANAALDLENDHIEQGDERKFGLKKQDRRKAFLKLQLKVIQERQDDSFVTVQGTIKTPVGVYKIRYEGDLEKFETDGSSYYFGPLDGFAKSKGGEEESVLGLYFNPDTHEAIATVSVGSFSDSVSVLYFGEPSEQMKPQIDKAATEKAKRVHNVDQIIPKKRTTVVTEAEESSALAGVMSMEQHYRFLGSNHSSYLTDTTQSSTDPVPAGKHYAFYVGVLDVYEIDNQPTNTNRQYQARVFSNTRNVASYMKNKFNTAYGTTNRANVTQINLFMGGSPNVHITEAYPSPKEPVLATNYWWLVAFGKVGDYLSKPVQLTSNLITSFKEEEAEEKRKVTITHGINRHSITRNANQFTIFTKKHSFENWFDIPFGETLNNSYKIAGGYSGNYWFEHYNKPYTVSVAARVQYAVSNLPYYHCYIWTDRMEVRNEY